VSRRTTVGELVKGRERKSLGPKAKALGAISSSSTQIARIAPFRRLGHLMKKSINQTYTSTHFYSAVWVHLRTSKGLWPRLALYTGLVSGCCSSKLSYWTTANKSVPRHVARVVPILTPSATAKLLPVIQFLTFAFVPLITVPIIGDLDGR